MNNATKKFLSILVWLSLLLTTILLSGIITSSLFWKKWELISVLSTFLFNFILVILFFTKKIDTQITADFVKALHVILLFIVPMVLLGFLTACYFFTIVEIQKYFTHITIALVTIVFLSYTIGDFVTFRHFKNANKLTEEKESWTNLVHLDIPFFISFMVLAGYYCIKYSSSVSLNSTAAGTLQLQLQSFIGGATAFQLLLQNTVYVIKTNIFKV